MERSENGRYVNVLFHRDMIHKIDEFRYSFRIESRTEAIRLLIEDGLKRKSKATKPKRRATAHSSKA